MNPRGVRFGWPATAGRVFAVLGAMCAAHAWGTPRVAQLAWAELAPLPPPAGQARQVGVAGPFAGVHGDVLIVAGGANFPDKLPWDGGAKAWWDDIWVLERRAGGWPRWVSGRTFKLPRPLGYGVSVSTRDGVLCAGGSDAERCHADVFLLAWDPAKREIRRTELPPMPRPLSFMTGALVGETLYVAGGQHTMTSPQASAAFWALDLSRRGRPDFGWEVLPAWPGPPRVLAVAAAQRTRDGEQFFLFSGRAPQAGGPTKLFTDAYAFDPATRQWRTLANVGGGAGVCVMAGSAAGTGGSEVLVFGGDGGERFLELEAHDLAIAEARRELANATADRRRALEIEINRRLAARRAIHGAHPGFSRDVLAYDVERDTWRVAGRSPWPLPVTTWAVPWGGRVVLPSGEIRPGVRTPGLLEVTPTLR